MADSRGCWQVFQRHLFPQRTCRGGAAKPPGPVHLIYKWSGCPICDHAAWRWASSIQTPEYSLFVLWLHPKRSREANFPHPIKKLYYVFLLARGAWRSEVTICALLLHKFAAKCAVIFARGLQLSPERVHSPKEHFKLLNRLPEPCLLWYFSSAHGNDNHLKCQPGKNSWQQKIHSALSPRMSYLPPAVALWARSLITNLGMPVGLEGSTSHLETLAW